MRASRSLTLIAACLLVLASCGKGPSKVGSAAPANAKLDLKQYKLSTTAFRTQAHAAYLKDPMTFAPLPDQGLEKGATAVVGSKVCRFYPGAALSGASELEKLGEGTPVPFGTILPIRGNKVKNPEADQNHGEMFNFQDNWNWFYPTSFQGKTGLVFGSDLYGLDDTNEQNRISARLYQTGGKYGEFYPILGYKPLSEPLRARLSADRLAFQSVNKDEYYLSLDDPDDMVSLYRSERSEYNDEGKLNMTPLFVSTDLVVHVQHLMFDRLLQYLEEEDFVPRLKGLCDDVLAKLEAERGGASGYAETLGKAELYLQVAKALLDLAPDKVEENGDYGHSETKYVDKEAAAVLSSYPEAVRAEIALMDKAEGFSPSAVFSFADGAAWSEDYSQYKPRGHYTKNGVLSAYFRAMMWFGRANFMIALNPNASEGDKKLVLDMAPVAFLLVDSVGGDTKLMDAWSSLFDPITALIGESDDISFKELLPLWKSEGPGSSKLGAWIGDRSKVAAFMAKAAEKLRAPVISGSSAFQGSGVVVGDLASSKATGANKGAGAPVLAWRLFGQRFTWDSYVHQLVSPPRLYDRDMVRGLDIMKAFGSQTADLLLAKSDYPQMRKLKETLDGIEKEFDAKGSGFWQSNYYNNVLYEIKTQAQFEPGAGFYFTETPAWGTKAMLSSHGTWAELRHDTILYVKQVYAERAGDGDFNPTFRTEPIPKPVHYLEPNLPFWQGAVTSVQKLASTLDSFGLSDEEISGKLKRLQELCVKAVEISGLEAADKEVERKDVDWIPTIPAELSDICLIHQSGSSPDEDQLKMALIADVYTNAELGKVLETGVGIPYRLYVALNDGQGGKRIAVGYTFSYYEFAHPMSDRMTDEQWKKIIYEPNARLGEYEPFWASGIALPAEKKQ
jgi:hypothetical protein